MRAAALCFAAALVLSQGAWAESKKDWDDCISSDAAVSLDGCSKIIARGIDTKNNLAIAYFNRGIAYQNKGDHAKAIAEFNQSIRLNASDPAPTAIAATPMHRPASSTSPSTTTIRSSS